MTESEKAFHVWFIQKYSRPPQVENNNRLDRVLWEGFQAAWDVRQKEIDQAISDGNSERTRW